MKLVNKLQKALLGGGTVIVEFVKKDGTLRRARVTRNLADIPANKHPKNKAAKLNGGLINLFDLVKGDWICCYADKITMVKPPLTAAQIRRKQEAARRWKMVKAIVERYHFTIGQALSIASGKTVDGCNLSNLSF